MEFAHWDPVYRAILDDFGFDRACDEHARDVLASLLPNDGNRSLPAVDEGCSTVAIAGAGASLEQEVGTARDADLVFAASNAADRLLDSGVAVDCVVTDLDKHGESVPGFTHDGIPVAIHAHGDNLDLVREQVPACDFDYVIPTTQAAPVGPVRNFGGFTDGDRTAFLADHLGARSLVFLGWYFEDPAVDAMKARKLRWAERLLYWLERRRGDRFGVLDGRREAVDTSALPLD